MSIKSSSLSENEFVVFYEKNIKENNESKVYIRYIQWTGNEAELTKLASFISKSEYDHMERMDHSYLDLDLHIKFPESHVDLQCKLSVRDTIGHKMFTKLTGKFTCPLMNDDLDMDPADIANLLSENFDMCRIVRMFV
jgi:hypothetical protein